MEFYTCTPINPKVKFVKWIQKKQHVMRVCEMGGVLTKIKKSFTAVIT